MKSLKYISWNVNGLRACIKKGFMQSFKELDADCFCLQETKLQPDQIELDLPGYYQYWNSAVKKGYSGTALFTKIKPLSVTYGIGMEEHDQEGRVITADFNDHCLVTCYTPNSQRGLARLTYRMKWEDDFKKYLLDLENGFTDSFRYLHPEEKDAYSWWSYFAKSRERNIGWRIDYFLVSDILQPRIKAAEIHSSILGSDHCPVELDIEI